jgi:hypothetical protein
MASSLLITPNMTQHARSKSEDFHAPNDLAAAHVEEFLKTAFENTQAHRADQIKISTQVPTLLSEKSDGNLLHPFHPFFIFHLVLVLLILPSPLPLLILFCFLYSLFSLTERFSVSLRLALRC